MTSRRKRQVGILLGLYALTSLLGGCVISPYGDGYYDHDEGHYHYREGYYDRDHGRWWHHHGWVQCGPSDFHCR